MLMNYLIIFLAIFGCDKCKCNDTPITLDVNGPYQNIRVTSYKSEHLSRIKFRARSSFCITKVIDAEEVIWESTNENESCESVGLSCNIYNMFILYLKIHTSDTYNSLYFKKNNDTWERISYHEYGRLLDRVLYGRGLDLNNHQDLAVRNTKITDAGNVIHTLQCNQSYFIIRVTDGDQIIWTGEDFESCRFIYLNCIKAKPMLLSLIILKYDQRIVKCFKKIIAGDNSEWVETEADDYNLAVKRVEYDTEIDLSSNANDDKMISYKHHPYGAPAIIYTPKFKYFLSVVHDGNIIIWENFYDLLTHCVDITVYHDKEDNRKLLQLFISNYTEFSYRFYEKKEHDWTEISKEEFYIKLKELDDEVERSKVEEMAE